MGSHWPGSRDGGFAHLRPKPLGIRHAQGRARLEAAREPIEPAVFHAHELDDLPEPVQRYCQAALKDGQPRERGQHGAHRPLQSGRARGENWKPFTSSQRVITRRPGFDWDARVALVPGLAVHVRDAYVAERVFCAAPLGLFTVMDVSRQPGVAEGELMRFFAEAAWYPTALPFPVRACAGKRWTSAPRAPRWPMAISR